MLSMKLSMTVMDLHELEFESDVVNQLASVEHQY